MARTLLFPSSSSGDVPDSTDEAIYAHDKGDDASTIADPYEGMYNEFVEFINKAMSRGVRPISYVSPSAGLLLLVSGEQHNDVYWNGASEIRFVIGNEDTLFRYECTVSPIGIGIKFTSHLVGDLPDGYTDYSSISFFETDGLYMKKLPSIGLFEMCDAMLEQVMYFLFG